MLMTSVAVIALLIANGLFVRFFFGSNLADVNDNLFQAAQFVLPIVMIFIEFWFYDWFTFRRHAKQRDAESNQN